MNIFDENYEEDFDESFDKAFDIVVGLEGGYSNNPLDAGGETMWGITERVAKASGYVGSMRDLTKSAAKKIYLHKYWHAVCADALPKRWAIAVFDASVNQGPEVAIKCMQIALQIVSDGVVGPQTLLAVSTAGDFQFARFLAVRGVTYSKTHGFDVFGLGWLTRLFVISQKAK